MRLGKTSDTGAGYVREIVDELVPVFERLEAKHPDADVEVFTCFRCLPDALGRKTHRRYDKRDNVLYLDMTFSEDRYVTLSKEEQRRELSHEFYDYLGDSLRKYRFAGLDVDAFLLDLRAELREIGWLKEPREIYLCAGAQRDECACITCILYPSP
ncbi:hypothetical protein [Allorhizocola rhizosphaerae]|uniref:hypothetical protein n=1 Tax=Allorhizocola rhizosphaerae TaxID=1872709 RepID=UPI000E3DC1FF|nr:hypothetical protein [Allorhizocola rhizosphaerae]